VEIRLSRHARRRAKLYGISSSTISDVIGSRSLSQGNHEIVTNSGGLAYPLKVVVLVEGDVATVITAYPLKRGGGK
jgi:hypothetical protein